MTNRIRLRGPLSLLAVATLLVLGGCAETQYAAQAKKRLTRDDAPTGVKVGRPYTVYGVRYHPKVEHDYDEEGIASWYGKKFHGRRTANGERYNMHAMTAAHKTLPMPSVVRVTNLENGRSLELRVNDRGPFIEGRIIDVSRRAAELLGFRRQGVAEVRVEFLIEETMVLWRSNGMMAEVPPTTPEPAAFTAATAAVPVPIPEPTPEPTPTAAAPEPAVLTASASPAVPGEAWYIQAGAFADYPNAETARARLSSIGPVHIRTVSNGAYDLYRVRLGPVPAGSHAEEMLVAVERAGYPGSHIVTE